MAIIARKANNDAQNRLLSIADLPPIKHLEYLLINAKFCAEFYIAIF